ncbi:MAG TPA: pyrroline-5-carboxylate reductase [Firmicutes bacterium]|nr:pyrroline-5-carboxylate reductase [Bacillota bacterium]
MEQRKVGVIGAGAMGSAIIRGLLRGGYRPEEILVAEPDEARRRAMTDLGIAIAPDNAELVRRAAGVVLAVKPQILPEVMAEIGPVFTKNKPLLSIAAGISTSQLESFLPQGIPVVRAMPNTPALVGEGVTALAGGAWAAKEHLDWARELLSPLGKTVLIREELMDAATGLSGSGPAYVFLFIEALIEAGVRAGLPRDIARDLVYPTVLGSVRMAIETGEHPAKLREQVTSPGGTTAAGLVQLEKGALRAVISEAVLAATQRSQELGKK